MDKNVKTMINSKLSVIMEKWEHNHVEVSAFIDEFSDIIQIQQIQTEKEFRGQGKGTTCIKEILDVADQYQCNVQLEPSQNSDTDIHKLIDWYEKLGFKVESLVMFR